MSVGDVVTRNICGHLMRIKITEITKDRVICGPWEFDLRTGMEVDEALGWTARSSGSFLLEMNLTP
jgi:nitrite reductase/ring-hydroxylating ferredoxin subunit